MLMLERNNRRRKKLSCLLVYNLVVETRNIQIKKKTPPIPHKTSRLFGAYILSDVCLQNKEEAGPLVAGYMRWVKASGRTEPLKESPEWVQKLVSFRETRVKGK